MKFKKIKVLFLLTIVAASMFSLTGCGKAKNTEVWQGSHANVGELLESKDSYIGDNSKDSSIISNLPMNEYSKGFEVQTSTAPYEMTIRYGDVEGNDVKFSDSIYASEPLDIVSKKNAMIIFALVKNVDIINFNINDSESFTYKKDEIITTYGEKYGSNLEKIIENESSLSDFLKNDLN